MVKNKLLLTILGTVIVSILLSGCGAGELSSPITPSPDMPTFLYFFTDG